ncbi:MAG: DUF3847 domain-containing protein [Lachnospiraceae bacterium]|nr:DUF3847 domain-containing protein [Lachnospiraceae bacterium]
MADFTKLEAARKERDEAELSLKQAERQINRKNNQIAKIESDERKHRRHMLCTKGAHIEYIFPVIKDSSKTDFFQFCDGLLKIPGVKEYAKNFKPKPIEEVVK